MPEPDGEYIIPLGKGNIVQSAAEEAMAAGPTCAVITYGMGVYWTKEASRSFPGRVEIMDLRTLNPLDWSLITTLVRRHSRAIIVTEEPLMNSFAESLAGRIQKECFSHLDAPVWTLGAANLPAVPLNIDLERMMLPSAEKVEQSIRQLLAY
jgi:2-oxoisovalerate dehydrogenase E1 component